ncbi:MAG: glycoside hydrolase family 113, partial [Pseudomonadota bacterium]
MGNKGFGKSIFLLMAICLRALSVEVPQVKGATLTEVGDYVFDAAIGSGEKTAAQKMVDRSFEVGVRHLVLSPRAVMTHPRNSEIVPMTPPEKRADERKRMVRLISYIHSKGMTVGIRPIFFVIDGNGHTPYVETLPDGSKKEWWHGNIQPEQPNAWFESFKTYLDLYLPISAQTGVEEFTIGAELYSMTVGIEDQWKANPHGLPAQWVRLLSYARTKLPPTTRIMYDINFT